MISAFLLMGLSILSLSCRPSKKYNESNEYEALVSKKREKEIETENGKRHLLISIFLSERS